MALAPLGFQVDTSGVAKAVADLSNMTAATGKAEAAAKSLSVNVNLAVNVVNKITAATTQAAAANDNMTAAINRQAAAIAKLTAAEARNTAGHYADRAADIAAYGMEMDRLRAKFDPLFAAQQRYAAGIEQVNRAQQVGAISASTAMQARIRETNAYQAQISVLNNLAAAHKATAQSMVDRVTVTPDRAADIAAYGAELDALRAKFNPIFAASKRYEQELNELNRAHRIGAISAAEQGAALAALNARYQAAGTATEVFGAQTRMAQQHARNLAFQIQDIGTMLAMGQSPFMLLAQQLPQVTMYGGRLNGVMGALKQTVAGLFSPLGLLTTGFVLAGSAAISYFTTANDEADASADALEEQADLIERVADAWGEALPALRAYADEVKRQRDEADRAAASQLAMNGRLEQAQTLIPAVQTALGEVMAELRRSQTASNGVSALADAFYEVGRAAQDFRDIAQDGSSTLDDYERVVEAVADLISNEVIEGHEGAKAAVMEYASGVLAAARAIQELAAQEAALAGLPGRQGRLGGETMDEAQERFNFLRRFNMRLNPEEFEDLRRGSRQPRERRGRKTEEERSAERYADLIRSSEQFIAMQELEQQALFMTEEAANALRYEQELLNQAANDNIKLTPEMAAELKALAGEMAATEAETQRLNEAFRFAEDVARGFFDDVFSALEDGKSLWEGFAQAGLNALQRIADKLLDMAMDELITGILGSILGALGGGFPSLPSSAPIPTPRPSLGLSSVAGISRLTPAANSNSLPSPRANIVPVAASAGAVGTSAGSAPQAMNFNINVSGARGNAEIMEMVGQGVREGLRQYDREAGPSMVKRVVNDPRAVG